MDLYVVSAIGSCSSFEPQQEADVSIVISPLRVEGEEGNLKVISGCSLWRGCENSKCQFSLAARQGPKMEKSQA